MRSSLDLSPWSYNKLNGFHAQHRNMSERCMHQNIWRWANWGKRGRGKGRRAELDAANTACELTGALRRGEESSTGAHTIAPRIPAWVINIYYDWTQSLGQRSNTKVLPATIASQKTKPRLQATHPELTSPYIPELAVGVKRNHSSECQIKQQKIYSNENWRDSSTQQMHTAVNPSDMEGNTQERQLRSQSFYY